MDEAQLRLRLLAVVDGRESVEAFLPWLAATSWGVPGSDILHSIELELAEYTSGHATLDELRDAGKRLLTSVPRW